MSYKTFMTFKHEEPASNGLVFATEAEADAYGRDLLMRWTMPTGHLVLASDEPVNYAYVDGRTVRLEVAP